MKKYIRILDCPVREDYWESGDIVQINDGQARLCGNWFTIDERWDYEIIDQIIIGTGDTGSEAMAKQIAILHGMMEAGSTFITPEELELSRLDSRNQIPEPYIFEMINRYPIDDDVVFHLKPSINPMDRPRGGKKKGRNKFGR